MKKVLFSLVLLSTFCTFGQNEANLKNFEAVDSNIGASIRIVKSSDRRMEVYGDPQMLNSLVYNIHNKSLKIRSADKKTDFSEIRITVYTPSISILEMSNGGKASLDASFQRIDHFEVSASGGAVIDLTEVEFKSLVAESSSGGEVLYKSGAQSPEGSSKSGSIQ